MTTDAIIYRPLHDAEDMRQAVELQKMVWGDDPEGVVPVHMLYSLADNGNPILGAFDGALLVGFSLAFLGTDVSSNRPAMANLKLASKRLAVHPDYRSSGIGFRLKLAQKEFADKQGIRLITWTFDPLISRNAYFHIHKLGAIARRFKADYFGQIVGQVDAIGTSDRLVCEWWLTSNRVEERLFGKRPPLTVQQYVEASAGIINPTVVGAKNLLMPFEGEVELDTSYHMLLAEIPADTNLFWGDPSLTMSWRHHTRAVFDLIFGAGYVATDFLRQEYQGRERGFYLMSYDGTEGMG